jgi:ubiquinone/menaquinone biosynthesis C-methylase UbiE
VDYDLTDIPAAYDCGRDHGPEVLDLWMTTLSRHLGGRVVTRILDLGCGTGRFSEALAARFSAAVVAIDPSMKMLAIARRKQRDPRVHYERGHAEAIPLASQSVDLVFMSMSLHHFADAALAARECRRVLGAEGLVVIRTGSREQIAEYPYVPFFPSAQAMLHDVLPDIPSVRSNFEAAGFRLVSSEIVTQVIAAGWAEYADKLSAGADSVLARLPRHELDAGLAALRSHATMATREDIIEPIDVLVFVPK